MPRRSLSSLGVLMTVALAACGSTPKATQEHDAANFNMQLGVAYMNRGDLGLAKEKLERAVAENPGDPNVHSAMAMLQDRLGFPDKADNEFRAALRLAPRNPDIQNNYAVYLCRTGRTEEGVKSFLEVAHNALYTTPEAALTNAGVCLRAAHRDDEAAPYFSQALQLKPNFAEAAFQLAGLNFDRGRLKDARSQIDVYLGAFDATPDLLLLGVRVTRALGDRLAAERYSRRLRLDFPSSNQTRSLSELDRNPG